MTTKKTTELQQTVDELTEQLATERAKTNQFGNVLGQLRYRVAEVLELDPPTRSTLLKEIDAVFGRAL
jgi:hypothetical protein